MPNKLVVLMYESWADLDRAVSGLTLEEATVRLDSGSSIAWTVGHVTNMLDSWILVRFQGLQPHPTISQPRFRTGGTGDAKDWADILRGVDEVRETARRFLDPMQEPDLDYVIPYDGSIKYLHSVGLSLRYAMMRIAAHHFVHTGEVATIRSRLGHPLKDYPEWGQALV